MAKGTWKVTIEKFLNGASYGTNEYFIDGTFVSDFNEAGINVENKNYTNDEVERFKIKVTDFIMSQSTKDIEKYSKKFSSLL